MDKLVIVVTHNPEFFKQYATRRVRVYDGKISEDRVIEKPAPVSADAQTEEIHTTKWLNFKNTLHIGVLNYKSRPKFTLMMTFALFVCAITMFLVISLFGQSLIQPTMTTLDNTGVEGYTRAARRSCGQHESGFFPAGQGTFRVHSQHSPNGRNVAIIRRYLPVFSV